MPRLILLNGPPGIGKSTIAQRFVDDHPLALDLDLDVVRSLLGWSPQQRDEAGSLSRELGLEMARRHLQGGYDVVVPQLVARLPFIEALEHLAGDVGADFHEVVLMDAKAGAIERFLARSRARAERDEPDEAGDTVEREGGVARLETFYDLLTGVLASRPHAVVITTEDGRIDTTYAALIALVTSEP
jgi:predicted kinase